MLITPDKLKLAKYLDNSKQGRAIDSLFFDQNKVVACNGHYLIQVEDTPPPSEDFPVIKGLEETAYIPDKILVTAKTATKVLKNLPKSKNLPILNNALIETDKDGNVSFGLTDLDSSIVIRQRKETGEYPDIDTKIPKDKPKAKTNVSVKYLQKIVGALSEFLNNHDTDRVEIALRGPESPIVFRCKKDDATITALIMPLRS